MERNAAETLQRETRIETTVWRQILGIAGGKPGGGIIWRKEDFRSAANYRCRFGEIDIIAREPQRDILCFVEVKTRSSLRKGRPWGSGYSGENTSSASNGAALPVEIPAGMQRHPDRCGGNFVHRSQILYPLYGKYYRISDEEGGIHCIRS